MFGIMRNLKDKGVLITGAGRGIGKRLAVGFAQAGARVGLLARSKAELDAAHLEIEHGGGVAMRIRADVCDFEQMCAAVERMRAHFGGLHVLVAAAAVPGPIGPLAEANPRLWAEAIVTNLVGVMHACRAALPHMIDRRVGKIIVLSGEGATGPRPNFSSYAAAKTAVVRLVETAAEEVREFNVQVNCMAPGGTYTHITDQILHAGDRAGAKARQEALEIRTTGGVSPERQIQLALFLASEHSNHITGKLIHVHDDWKRLETATVHPDGFTLRRIQRV
jgi:NAD(P)-dependent dehydrogenase (short-subunit alcohol dehydrogenase family)